MILSSALPRLWVPDFRELAPIFLANSLPVFATVSRLSAPSEPLEQWIETPTIRPSSKNG
jgi:hypothetical protein